jgi:hypothetical protein
MLIGDTGEWIRGLCRPAGSAAVHLFSARSMGLTGERGKHSFSRIPLKSEVPVRIKPISQIGRFAFMKKLTRSLLGLSSVVSCSCIAAAQGIRSRSPQACRRYHRRDSRVVVPPHGPLRASSPPRPQVHVGMSDREPAGPTPPSTCGESVPCAVWQRRLLGRSEVAFVIGRLSCIQFIL